MSSHTEDLPPEDLQQAIGEHWDNVTRTKEQAPRRDRWVYSDFVHSILNERIIGKRVKGPNRGLNMALKTRLGDRVLGHGVSVGGGTGLKEMRLIKQGFVERFTIFDLSVYRIEQGVALAKESGLEDRVKFVRADPFESPPDTQYDFVHWQAALHHMFDVDHAVRWSREVLLPKGIMYVNEYVGPNRMQYSDEMVELASRIRALLPERYFSGGRNPNVKRRCVRPKLETVVANDPSECVDSESILPSLRAHFPEMELWLQGGIGYSMALTNLIANFDEDKEEDLEWLSAIMGIDGMLSKLGFNLRAAGIASI
jgi:ubiquinone/menaquinone biosynthesis C-methylase UbiE